jgi:hypothetical protein
MTVKGKKSQNRPKKGGEEIEKYAHEHCSEHGPNNEEQSNSV